MVSHGYPPTTSGVTRVVQKVAREMVRRGHEVSVVTASDRGTPYHDQDNGVALWRVRSTPNPFWSEGRLPMLSYTHLKEIIAEIQPDVINTHDGALLSWQLYRLERERSHIPEVLTCHYLPRFVTYYVHVGEAVEKAVENITWELTRRMINAFDHVVFPTQLQRQAFLEEGLERDSTVISNGVDTNLYRPGDRNEDAVEARYGLPDGPRILVVGRLARDKKIEILIRAMSQLRSALPAHLLLVGRGDDRDRLERLIESLGLQDCVHFLGFVPEADLPSLYRHADVFAIASDVEVQSIPTLQAVATGLPVVAANAAALPELVKDGGNGYLVPPSDPAAFAAALSRILDSPQEAAAFGRVSLEISRQHAEGRTYDAYEGIFRKFALKPASPGRSISESPTLRRPARSGV
jgi:glycosyltransferase involved in cell wall biosynthesis